MLLTFSAGTEISGTSRDHRAIIMIYTPASGKRRWIRKNGNCVEWKMDGTERKCKKMRLPPPRDVQ